MHFANKFIYEAQWRIRPDLELRVGGGGGCFACPDGFLPSVIFLFYIQNMGGGGHLGPFS